MLLITSGAVNERHRAATLRVACHVQGRHARIGNAPASLNAVFWSDTNVDALEKASATSYSVDSFFVLLLSGDSRLAFCAD